MDATHNRTTQFDAKARQDQYAHDGASDETPHLHFDSQEQAAAAAAADAPTHEAKPPAQSPAEGSAAKTGGDNVDVWLTSNAADASASHSAVNAPGKSPLKTAAVGASTNATSHASKPQAVTVSRNHLTDAQQTSTNGQC